MAVGDVTRVRAMDQQFLTTSVATKYTIPANRQSVRIEIDLCNTDESATHDVEIYFVPSGGSASADELVVNKLMSARERFAYTFHTFLEAGDFIAAKAETASKITMGISVVLEETS